MARRQTALALAGAALLACAAGAAAQGLWAPSLMPQLGISREGAEKTFTASTPVSWQVARNSGSASYTLVASTPTSITLQAGRTGGGEFTIVASLGSADCTQTDSAVAKGANCNASSSWRILSAVETYLLGAMLLFGSSNGVVFLYRFWRRRQEAREQANERRSLKLSRNEFGAL